MSVQKRSGIMKKLGLIVLSLFIVLTLSACRNDDAFPTKTLTYQAEYPIYLLADFNQNLPETLPLYYFDDESMPYVDIEHYFTLLGILNNQIGYSASKEGHTLTITHQSGFDGNTFSYNAKFNAKDNTIHSSSALMGTTDIFYITSFQGVNYGDYAHQDKEDVKIDLDDYTFSIETLNNRFYLSLNVLMLLFNPLQVHASFQGDAIYFGHQGSFDAPLESTLDETLVPLDVMESTVNYLKLLIDYKHGASIVRAIDSDAFLEPYMQGLLNASTHYDTLERVIYALDDLYTYPIESHLYLDETLFIDLENDKIEGSIWVDRKDSQGELNQYCAGLFEQEDVYTKLDVNTAHVLLPGLAYNSMTPQFMSMIATDEAIDTVVLDLSCIDFGGHAQGFVEVLSLLTNDTITINRTHTLDDTTINLTINPVNTDFKDYHFILVTSSRNRGYTSLLTSIAKENDLATIIGSHLLPSATERYMAVTPSGQHFYYGGALLFDTHRTHNILEGTPLDYTMTSHTMAQLMTALTSVDE
jgi:hypothetical protein